MGPNARFGYPLRGGFQALMDGFLPHLRGELMLKRAVVRVAPKRTPRGWTTDARRLRQADQHDAAAAPDRDRRRSARRGARGRRESSPRFRALREPRHRPPALTDKHWIYYPEDTVFHRIFVQGNASPHCNPPGGFGLTCEITYSPTKPLPADGDALIDRCIADCIRVGLFHEDDPILSATQIDMPYAYVVYDHARAASVACVREWLADHDIVLAGRYSEWEYYNSDHAFLAGKKAAEAVSEAGANAMSLIA